MQENMKEYLTEKEAKEKRLEVYTEKIQEKVLSRSSETIRQLVDTFLKSRGRGIPSYYHGR